MSAAGRIISLHIAASGGGPIMKVEEVRAVAGKGLQGDRYAARLGTYSNEPGSGREVTLIEIEAIEALQRDYQITLEAGSARRNIVTRGVYLNHLVGKEFSAGAAVLRGARLCEPCAHMEKLTVKGALRGLVHRGGLRAEIVKGGMIRVGDVIRRTGAAKAFKQV
jgi:MOSC domain-containing protein YiiM